MANSILLKNALLIDGEGGEPLSNAAVLVREGRIEQVESGSQNVRVPSARVFDLKGRTLMPGLIDAHTHAGNIELRLAETSLLPPAVYVHRATRNLETDLQLGFTTVRDAAGLDDGFRAAIEKGLIQGPRVLLSINPLTQSGAFPVAPRNSLGVYPEVCDGPDAVRRAARCVLGRGAHQIKVFADGEVVAQLPGDRAAPGQWKFTVEELRAAVETAQASGTYVMAHAYGPRAIQNGLAAGVRSIEHGNLLDDPTAALMAEGGTFLVPTLTVYDLLAGEAGESLDAASRGKLALVGRAGKEAVERARRAGVKIGSGSDIIGPYQGLKGRELSLKAEVMGAMGAITSATRTNAELLGLADRLGTIAPGKWADLIAVDGNPLEDPSLFEQGLEKVVLVMKQGRIYKDLLT